MKYTCTIQIDIEDNEVNKLLCYPKDIYLLQLLVGYEVVGKFLPATLWEPMEYPELTVNTITVEKIQDEKEFWFPTAKQSEKIISFLENEHSYFKAKIFMEKIAAECWVDYEQQLESSARDNAEWLLETSHERNRISELGELL